MKIIIKKTMPFVLAVLIVFQTIFSSVQTAQASAIPEVLYYTYWDLINTIYATCGYDSKVDESVVNNHGVTGKQAWGNFVTFVENSAKANYKFVGDGMSKAFSELENLVNTATEKGISMTQDLYDMLKSVFANQVSSVNGKNQFDCSSRDSVYNSIVRICGVTDSYKNTSILWDLANSIYYNNGILNIVYRSGVYILFCYDAELLSDKPDKYNVGPSLYYLNDKGNRVYITPYRYFVDSLNMKCSTSSGGVFSMYADSVWIVRRGAFAGTDTISAQVSEGACPQEVPEVAPWRKSVDIPDEWRRANPKESPDKDPKKDPEILPPIIPIPLKPSKPDSTEETTEKPSTETTENPDSETTEKPDKGSDKKKKPAVCPIINPDTGNVIDPNTGWDIDPSTGKLINPNTGELVDPDMSNPSSLTKKFGDITKLFPFCIPFDLVHLIRGMNAEKKPPVFHYEHKFKDINYTFVVDVDLSDYDKYIKLFRYGMQIFYVLALMFLTAKISTYFA